MFNISINGSIAFLTPRTQVALEWAMEYLNIESWQWLGGSITLDVSCLDEILFRIESAGFQFSEV